MDSCPHNSDSGHHASIPADSDTTKLRCCCGRDDCALLENNNVALEGLEKDLETAALLGQVREVDAETRQLGVTAASELCMPGFVDTSLWRTFSLFFAFPVPPARGSSGSLCDQS